MINRKLFAAFLAVMLPCLLSAQDSAREKRLLDILNSLTLEEKANLSQGDPGVERLGIPSFEMTDGGRGPHGNGEPVTGFPAGIGMASAAGLYAIAVVATALALAGLEVFGRFNRFLRIRSEGRSAARPDAIEQPDEQESDGI